MSIPNTSLPRATHAFVEFAQILRRDGFAIAPDQTTAFIEAIQLLGPSDISDIRHAGRATFAIPQERLIQYDALFRSYFLGMTVSSPVTSDDDDDEVEAYDQSDGEQEVPLEEDESEIGEQATTTEVLARRGFSQVDEDDALRQFESRAGNALPRRSSPRRQRTNKGDKFDMRRSLRNAVKRDGEVFDLMHTRRKLRQRPIVLLIDVSGSMSEQAHSLMLFAHTLKQSAERAEVFTFGTRLTRISQALSDKNADRALEKVSSLVADFDGGTRIGDALDALLSVPRFASTMRGAAVVIISDGLERGTPDMMLDAVKRIARLAWRLEWLTPLAGSEDYVPRTEALAAVLPWLDNLGSAADTHSISENVLALAETQRRRAA